jgi:hypothetical protein
MKRFGFSWKCAPGVSHQAPGPGWEEERIKGGNMFVPSFTRPPITRTNDADAPSSGWNLLPHCSREVEASSGAPTRGWGRKSEIPTSGTATNPAGTKRGAFEDETRRNERHDCCCRGQCHVVRVEVENGTNDEIGPRPWFGVFHRSIRKVELQCGQQHEQGVCARFLAVPEGERQHGGEQCRDEAGPISGTYSPTRLTAEVIPSTSSTTVSSAVSTQQYTLTGSDGSTWQSMDTTTLQQSITPTSNVNAIISGNSDLWTSSAGYNQDIGLWISGGVYGTGQVVAWKESGGFAGTFSPNAAYVHTVLPLVANTTYSVKLVWKTNKADPDTIWAGAGPISTAFSPTRLTAELLPSG